MEEILQRITDNLIARVTGPMQFRVIFQPLMASIFAVMAGLKDAANGKPAYFWAIFTSPSERAEMLRDGWKQVGKIFILAMLLDVVYQLIVQRFVYPLEVVLVAFILAIVPYLTMRGLVNRFASRVRTLQVGPRAEK